MYLHGERYNNVDLRYDFQIGKLNMDIVAASNRDKKVISLFKIYENNIEHLTDLPLVIGNNHRVNEEPYGLCLVRPKKNGRLYAFSPMKSGQIHQHEIVFKGDQLYLKWVRTLYTDKYLTREQDNHSIDITMKEVIWEENLPKEELLIEVKEKVEERFQLEGCVADDENEVLYYGMENLGVFKVGVIPPRIPWGRPNVKMIARVVKSKTEPNMDRFPKDVPRIVNDIEGLALHYGPDGRGALVVSIQRLDEFAFLIDSLINTLAVLS